MLLPLILEFLFWSYTFRGLSVLSDGPGWESIEAQRRGLTRLRWSRYAWVMLSFKVFGEPFLSLQLIDGLSYLPAGLSIVATPAGVIATLF